MKRIDSPSVLSLATIGALAITYLHLLFLGTQLGTGLGLPLDLGIAVLGGSLVIGLASLVAWPLCQLLRVVGAAPGRRWAVILGSAFAFIGLMLAFSVPAYIAVPFGLGLFLGQIAIAGGVGLLAESGPRILLGLGLLGLGLLVDLLIAAILLAPGTRSGLFQIDQPLPDTQLADPSRAGPYLVLQATYGRGDDLHRPEFAHAGTWQAGSANLLPFVQLPASLAELRARYWGFGLDDVPLNGTVWYPEGAGPFPIVFMVHGNALMTEPADKGYAYLGKLLASHGFIFISVDQNFLNAYLGGPLQDENDARAVLLLEHINQWVYWSTLSYHPLSGNIDFGELAVIGHSRGGEAAVIAAHFASLNSYPDDPKQRFNYPVRIKTVIGIAPAVTSYRPRGMTLEPENFNYLLLQGSHDADSYINWGEQQLREIRFTDGQNWLKASIYAFQANHSQFNSTWGRRDAGPPEGWLLNTRQLMTSDEQQQFAQIFIHGFLMATLKGDAQALDLFRDPRLAGHWLAGLQIKGHLTTASFIPLLNFENGSDQANWWLQGLAEQDVRPIASRRGQDIQNRALHLIAAAAGAQLIIEVPDAYVLPEQPVLSFRLSDPRPYQATQNLVDFSVQLNGLSGELARVIMSDYVTILPPFAAQFTKWVPLELSRFGAGPETIFQTVDIKLDDLASLTPEQVVQIRFIFDQTAIEALIIDDLGFRSVLHP